MSSHFVTFLPLQRRVAVRDEESVLELALRNGIPLTHSCGGMGACTTCRIFVEHTPQPLPERNELEQEHADTRAFQPNERLSCQLPPFDGLVVRIPEPLTKD